jgi:hypothetical protein
VTKGGAKAKFFWVASQWKEVKDLKFLLCLAPILILIYLEKPFDIEIDASDYVIGAFLTHHGHLVSYHNETLLDFFIDTPLTRKRCITL